MQYSFKEIHALNLLSDNPEYSKRFNTPADLKIMTGVILLILVVTVTCAIVFKVDKIVPAQGVLDTQAKLFEVRSPNAGFVRTIHVKEGEQVAEGDTLVSFDTQLMDLDIQRLGQDKKRLSREIWTDYYEIQPWLEPSIQASLDDELNDVPNPVEALGIQSYLTESLRSSLDTMDQSISGLRSRLSSLSGQLKLSQQGLTMAKQELARVKRLNERDIESRAAVDERERAVLNLESSHASLLADQAATRSDLEKLKAERKKTRDDFILQRLLSLQDELDQYHQTLGDLAASERKRRDMTVQAPFDAVVDEVLARGRHEVMDAGTPLVELRPLFDRKDLEVDISIPSNYAIWVKPGMEFRASSLGNNPEDHGRLHGVVTFVSKSSEVKEGRRIYRMKGRITKMEVKTPETFLRPGLQLAVEIKAGDRRLINYLFDPFTKNLRTALSEPS